MAEWDDLEKRVENKAEQDKEEREAFNNREAKLKACSREVWENVKKSLNSAIEAVNSKEKLITTQTIQGYRVKITYPRSSTSGTMTWEDDRRQIRTFVPVIGDKSYQVFVRMSDGKCALRSMAFDNDGAEVEPSELVTVFIGDLTGT